MFSFFSNTKNIFNKLKWLYPYVNPSKATYNILKSLTFSTFASIANNLLYDSLVNSLVQLIETEEIDNLYILKAIGYLGFLSIATSYLYTYANTNAAMAAEKIKNKLELEIQSVLLKNFASPYDLEKIVAARINNEHGIDQFVYTNLTVFVPNVVNVITLGSLLSVSLNPISLIILISTSFLLYLNTSKTNANICQAQQEHRAQTQVIRELFEENIANILTISYFQGQIIERKKLEKQLNIQYKKYRNFHIAHNTQDLRNTAIQCLNFIGLAYQKFSYKNVISTDVLKGLIYINRLNDSIINLVNILSSQVQINVDLEIVKTQLQKNKPKIGNIEISTNLDSGLLRSIEFRNVSYEIENRRILNNISFVIETKERIALTGPSGSGKTTLILLLSGLYQPTSGEIIFTYDSKENFDAYQVVNNSEHRKKVVTVIQQEPEVFKRSLEENIIYGGYDSEPNSNLFFSRREKFLKFSLEDKVDKTVLSGGQKKLISMMRAMNKVSRTRSSVIIFDESFTNIDKLLKREMFEMFESLNQERAIISIFVSHQPDIINKCSREISICDGKVNHKLSATSLKII